ncbi:minor capsid VP3 protein [African elephant polyomavirus 1]|nr:minor capsid VP3 protein [African elephant polyomavirus 1]AGV77093.1 minor capsid VP3 protein [African elephant polyomavirus 1]
MALQLWFPPVDYLFPGVTQFSRFLRYIDPTQWGPELFHHLTQAFFSTFRDATRRQLTDASRNIAERTAKTLVETLVDLLTNATWAIAHLPSDVYTFLDNYYEELPPLNPAQFSGIRKRLGKVNPYEQQDVFANTVSAEFVTKVTAPGGAMQKHAPDWVLPLLLGLFDEDYRQVTPRDGPAAKRRRTTLRTIQKTPPKTGKRPPNTRARRSASSRSKKRA